MSNKYIKDGLVRPEAPSHNLDTRLPTTPNYTGAMGVFGSLSSLAKRRAAHRYERELEALGNAVEAARRLNEAREAYARSQARLTRDNLQKMAIEEQARVDTELAEQELRRADAIRRQMTFEKRNEIEDENLEADLLEAKLRRKHAQEALTGISSKPDPTAEEKRQGLEREIENLFREIESLDSEYIRRTEASTVDEAYEGSYNTKRNRLKDKLDKKMAQEEAL